MANVGERLSQITECSICMSAFTDPRMLPCIHNFCLECLERNAETATSKKKPGDKMPCPLCRTEFAIPPDGMTGLQRNFFMESLLELESELQVTGSATIICDVCNLRNKDNTGHIPTAVMRCIVCQSNYCDSCVKDHQLHTVNENHQMENIGGDFTSGIQRVWSVKSCTKHNKAIPKPLDCYCTDCKKIVCVTCVAESHKLHDWKDVTTVDEEFRQAIGEKACLMSNYAAELVPMRKKTEMEKKNFLKNIVKTENAILQRNQQLKDLIDRDTKSILDELSVIKSNHQEQIEIELEEIDIRCTILKSFEAYCIELKLKGSASDICSSVDQLLARADDLERDHEENIGPALQSIEVSFQAADLLKVSHRSISNFVGEVNVKAETISQFENYAVVGLSDGPTITNDVIKINLHRPNEISTQEQIPTKMQAETFAAVYCNTMYVTGVGANKDEIWKYGFVSGWVKCASLFQGRRRHSAAFVDEVLYICGGFVDSTKSALDSVEAYNAITDKCAAVGKVVHCVQNQGNCVPFKSSLYIFGGSDKDYKSMNCVQVYNTKTNTCSVLSKPMPWGHNLMRAILWETSVILVGRHTCFIFNFETETWQEREQFKTDVIHFGLLFDNERIFVIGGGDWETDNDGKTASWKCRDDVRYVPLQNIIDDKHIEWKIHGTLPKPTLVQAYANMRVLI